MNKMPANMPGTLAEAYAHIATVEMPSIDDFKILLLIEAGAQGSYNAYANAAPNDAVRQLLAKNGQEEVAHAHRISRVIKQVYGEEFVVPSPENNPYYDEPVGITVDEESLAAIAAAENGGEALYEAWAATVSDSEAARQLRQNGKEETKHGSRAQEAIALLAA